MDTLVELEQKLFEFIKIRFPGDLEMQKVAVYTVALNLMMHLEQEWSEDKQYFTIEQFERIMNEFVNVSYASLLENTEEK